VTAKGDENELLQSVVLQNATSILAARRRAERRSEAYLAEAQRLSHTGSFGWQPSTGEIIWSEETFRIFQLDRSTKPTVELILQRVHPNDAALVKETIERAAQDGKDFEHEFRLVMPNGGVKHVHVVAHAERDGSGEVEFVGAVMDITESKRAEKKLRRSEESLLEAQKLSHTGSWRHDVASGEVTVSPEVYRIHDIKPDDDPSNTEFFFSKFHPEDRKRVVDLFERSEIEKTEFQVDYRIILPDGTIKHLHTIGRPILNESGDLVEFVGTAMDVTAAKQAEEALRRSESNLAEAQRLTHTGSWAWRVAGRVALHLSEEWYRIYGFDPEGDMPAWEQRLRRVHPEDRAKWQGAIDRAIAEKSDYEVEFRIVLSDGTVKYIHTVGHPVFNASGDLAEFVGSATDITERKQAELLLAGEKRLLEMIARGVSRAPILEGACLLVEELAGGSLCSILLLDPGAKCLRHGAAPSLSKTYTEAIDGAVIGPSVGSCGTAAYRAEPVIVSDIATDPLWADFRALASAHELRACWSTPILSSAGSVLGTFATYYREPRSPSSQELNVIERITHLASIAIERKQAEEKLRQSEAYLAEAQRLSHTGSWAGAPGMGEIRYWSEECYRVLGFDPHAGQPRVETFFQRIHPDDRARTLEHLERAGGEKAEFEFDYRIVHPGGEIRNIHTIGHPVFNPSGDLVEFVGTVIDVTERKQAEQALEALREAQADLARVSRVTTMGELTASLAHEVNQPIAAASTNANTCLRWLAGDTPNIEEARAAAMRIVKDGKRAGEIVSRIRQLFRKGTSQRELVDVNEIILEMTVLLRGETTRYNILVGTDLAVDLLQVMADRVQLQQVLMNLMINGIEAMKDADGTRELAIRSQRMQNEEVMVSVTDSGVGLPPQQTEQIFNAFFTTKPHGTGMGLRISRSIIESHGGRLWAANNSPRGASFCFSLPTKAEAPE
jgi:PAS domain S-box-containing protein